MLGSPHGRPRPGEDAARAAVAKGILLMVGGGFVLTFHDAVMKWLTEGYSAGEITFYRGLFGLVPLAFFAWREGGVRCLRTRRPGAQALRAGFMVGSAFLFVVSLSLMPLADATALSFTGPLFLTALAQPLLGERVDWRRWAAVAVGFAGVVLMMRPSGAGLDLVVLVPVASALLAAFRDVFTRRLVSSESPTAILFYTTLAMIAGGWAMVGGGWTPLVAADAALFLLIGIMFNFAHYLYIIAFRLAEVAVVAPFKYASLLWATLLGYFVWNQLPDAYVVAGSTLVVAAGLYILDRETGALRRLKARLLPPS